MKKEFSIYLDLIRFIAALLVLVHHSNMRPLIGERVWFSQHGPAAVIIFFVLSGYVISYAAATKQDTPVEYWACRLARFYSLAIPIVLICPLLDMAGESLAPQFYGDRTTHGLALLRIFTSLTYLNEIWTLAIVSFSNVPYWSLNYEMWYYVMFAIVTFMRGRPRTVFATATVLFVGPKILLLAPIWILGVVMHRHQKWYGLRPWQYWALFLASWPLYWLYQEYHVAEIGSKIVQDVIGAKWTTQLAFSKYFLANYILGLVVAANFIGFRGIAQQFSMPLLACEKPIRTLAAYTFSLYILHQPFLQFYAAVINGDASGHLFYAEVLAATVLTVFVFSTFTEQRSHLLRAQIRRALSCLMATEIWRKAAGSILQARQY